MTQDFEIYKEGTRWFFDDPKKGVKHEEFVSFVPFLIEEIANGKNRVHVKISDLALKKAFTILYFQREEAGGAVYKYRETSMWFCPVFWRYFEKPPKKIWIENLGDSHEAFGRKF